MTGARLATAAYPLMLAAGVVVLAVLYACEKRHRRRAEARAAERAARPHSAHTATPGQDAAAIPRHTVNTITSDALDQLYEQLEQQTAKAGDVAEWFKEQRRRAEQAEAALDQLYARIAELERNAAIDDEVIAKGDRETDELLDAGRKFKAWAEQQKARADRAESAIARVRALRTDWLSTGAPPIGTSIARWWDKRLTELATALDEPKEPTLPTFHLLHHACGQLATIPGDVTLHPGRLSWPGHDCPAETEPYDECRCPSTQAGLELCPRCPGNTTKEPAS